MIALLLDTNLSEGGLVALKMMGGVAIAAVLLYLVLVLTRILGTKLEQKKYEKYCETYRQTHESEEGMLSREQFVEERAKGNAIVWRKGERFTDSHDNAATPAGDSATDAKENSDAGSKETTAQDIGEQASKTDDATDE